MSVGVKVGVGVGVSVGVSDGVSVIVGVELGVQVGPTSATIVTRRRVPATGPTGIASGSWARPLSEDVSG